jgi:hypothetical protein
MKERKTYTFDSWLNDEIIETMFGELIVESLGLQYLHRKGQLEKEDWENIKKHQLWTFDKALDMALCFKKEGFIEILDKVIGSTDEFIRLEIEFQEAELKKSEERRGILLGTKMFGLIKGSQYLEVKKNYDKWQANNSYEFIYLNSNMDSWLTYKYLEWLNSYSVKSLGSGLKSNLKDSQIKALYNGLLQHHIAKNTKFEHFESIFKIDILPSGFIPIRWIFLNPQSDPHKTALRAMLTTSFGKGRNVNKACKFFFVDKSGNQIVLAKRKPDPNFQALMDRFHDMINK